MVPEAYASDLKRALLEEKVSPDIEWRRIVLGVSNGETQALDLGRIVVWPERFGRLWDCDLCGVEFTVGETMALHDVTEEDYGQGPYQERSWFQRIHVEHYTLEPRG